MSQEANILNLCQNCITALRNTINSNIPRELSLSLNQKLFLLETAVEDFKENHTDFEEICNHLIDPIYVADRNGKTIYINQAYLDFSGLKKEDLVGKSVSKINYGEKLCTNKIISEVMNTKKQTETVGTVILTNKKLQITGTPILDENGELKYVVAHYILNILPVAAFRTEPEPISSTYLEKTECNLKKSVEAFEKDIIRNAIAQHGSKRKAATALGVDHSTLIKKCQRYGI
ncbi:MAG: PAS domain-containing protein [Aminipila sp.]